MNAINFVPEKLEHHSVYLLGAGPMGPAHTFDCAEGDEVGQVVVLCFYHTVFGREKRLSVQREIKNPEKKISSPG